MSDSSLVELSYIKETVWGVTPAAAMTELPMDSENLKQTTQTRTSKQIRKDRQVKDVTRTNVEAGGDVNFTAQYKAHDDLLAGAMMNTWGADISAVISASVTIAATATGFTDSANQFAAAGIVVGQWIKASGFANSLLNVFYRVTSVSAGVIATSPVPVATEVAGASVTIKGSLITNGVTKTSFSLEKFFSDIGEYVSYPGMRVNSLKLTIPSTDAITGVMSFQGQKEVGAGATIGTGSLIAAPTFDELTSVDNFADVRLDGALSTLDFTEVTLSMENKLRAQPSSGKLGPIGIGLGTINLAGTIKAYFESRTEMDKYRNFTAVAGMSWRHQDAAGNAYVFDIGSMKFTDGQQVAGGIDQDVIAELSWVAKLDALTGVTLGINRFAA